MARFTWVPWLTLMTSHYWPVHLGLLLKICEEYSEKFRIVFNATKSACMVVGKKVRHWSDSGKYFTINGNNILKGQSIYGKYPLNPQKIATKGFSIDSVRF